MNVNLALISGQLALPADLERLSDGSRRARLLVCVRSKLNSRFDVLPVVVPPDVVSDSLATARAGTGVWVAGRLIRRCPPEPWEPPGRIEVVASSLAFPDVEFDRPHPGAPSSAI